MIFEDEKLNLSKISFNERHEFYNCTFSSQDLKELKVTDSFFDECIFKNIDLSNCSLTNSKFSDCTIEESKLIGINWTSISSLMNCTFNKCILDYSIFNSMKLSKNKFIHSSIKEADFSESELESVEFCFSDLYATNFSGSNLKKSDFRNATNYSIDPAFSNIKKAKFSLPEAINLLKSFDIIVE